MSEYHSISAAYEKVFKQPSKVLWSKKLDEWLAFVFEMTETSIHNTLMIRNKILNGIKLEDYEKKASVRKTDLMKEYENYVRSKDNEIDLDNYLNNF